MSVLTKGMGGSINWNSLTPYYRRSGVDVTGCTIGHRYLIAFSNLNVTGSSRDYRGQSVAVTGMSVEFNKEFGDGDANSNQRAWGGLLIGKATSATISLNPGGNNRVSLIALDLG